MLTFQYFKIHCKYKKDMLTSFFVIEVRADHNDFQNMVIQFKASTLKMPTNLILN